MTIKPRSAWATPAALLTGLALAWPEAAPAQDQASPIIPGLEGYSVPPKPTPTPQRAGPPGPAPEPSATPSPVPTTSAEPPAPQPQSTPGARATRAPTPTVTPAPTPTPRANPRPVTPPTTAVPASPPRALVPSPPPTPTVTPTSTRSTPIPTPRPATPEQPTGWPIWAGLAALVGAVLAVALLWQRRRVRPRVMDHEAVVPAPDLPPPAPTLPASAPIPVAGAQLSIAFAPRRAGLNLTGAAVDYHLTIRNDGDAPARDIHVGISVLTVSERQEVEIERIFATPIERPVLAPFPLGPGEDAMLEGMAMLPQTGINVVTVAGKRLLAPFFLVNVLYTRDPGEAGQVAAAWLVGIDQGAGAKLGPFLVDRGPRMHAQVAAREHRMMRR